MENAWELEHEIEQPPKLEFKSRAQLVLEGSDRHDWGVVKDCHGRINFIPDDAEIVGTWNKYASGPEGNLTFWVSLQTSLSALEDRATQLYKELSESRQESMSRMGEAATPRRTARVKAQPKGEHEAAEKEIHDGFESLRQRLGGG